MRQWCNKLYGEKCFNSDQYDNIDHHYYDDDDDDHNNNDIYNNNNDIP